MSKKEELKTELTKYADSSSDLDLQSSIGTEGRRIQIRGDIVDTGQAYTIPGFVDGLLTAIGAVMDGAASIKTMERVVVSSPQKVFVLSHTPLTPAHLFVFKNYELMWESEIESPRNYQLQDKTVTLSETAVAMDALIFRYDYRVT